MSSLISVLIQAAALRACFGLVCAGSAVAAHAAQSGEDPFAAGLDIFTIQPERSGVDWLLPSELGASVVPVRSPDAARPGFGGGTFQFSSVVRQQQDNARAINMNGQPAYGSDRVSLPRLLRVEFKLGQVNVALRPQSVLFEGERFKVTFRPQSALIEGERFKVMLQPHSASMLWSRAF